MAMQPNPYIVPQQPWYPQMPTEEPELMSEEEAMESPDGAYQDVVGFTEEDDEEVFGIKNSDITGESEDGEPLPDDGYDDIFNVTNEDITGIPDKPRTTYTVRPRRRPPTPPQSLGGMR